MSDSSGTRMTGGQPGVTGREVASGCFSCIPLLVPGSDGKQLRWQNRLCSVPSLAILAVRALKHAGEIMEFPQARGRLASRVPWDGAATRGEIPTF